MGNFDEHAARLIDEGLPPFEQTRHDMWQQGRLVGSVPRFPPESRSRWLFDVRPNDFRLRPDNAIEVDWSVMPGDLLLLKGFKPPVTEEK